MKDRKERERFQAKIELPKDASHLWPNYLRGQSFEVYLQKTLKVKSFAGYTDRGKQMVICFFESQKDLHSFMEAPHHWKLTISTPLMKKSSKSKKDKKQNSKSSKEKKAGSKRNTSEPMSLTKSHDKSKSKKHNKGNDDTRSLLKLILNLLQ